MPSTIDEDARVKAKTRWREKSWPIPDLLGGKQHYFALVVKLVELIDRSGSVDLSGTPDLSDIGLKARPWREYSTFLRSVGLALNESGRLRLTPIGEHFRDEPTKMALAEIFQDRYRLFGELLPLLKRAPTTVQEMERTLSDAYHLQWKNCTNTRRRMDWLEVLGLISNVGNRRWGVTREGERALGTWDLVDGNLVTSFEDKPDVVVISPAPTEIDSLLRRLEEDPSLHLARRHYNIWAPSPHRIDNLRAIVTFASDAVSRSDLYSFIENRFHLKSGSVDSMMPFLKAAGLIAEVGKGVYRTTSAAQAWCETGSDLDFIRILHANMRFVGEMIRAVDGGIARNEMYEQAQRYGLNTEKARWIAGFLQEAGLLEEPRYLHLKSTALGREFLRELPLADAGIYEQDSPDSPDSPNVANADSIEHDPAELLFSRLHGAARDPLADGDQSGAAFEKAIAEVFAYAGFDVQRIGGPGDTDVLVRWRTSQGDFGIATVDGKSKSSGTVTHTDVSDIALETHRDKHHASYTAIVGPGFGGDTIRDHAAKKGFALISDEELTQIVRAARELGFDAEETALIFQVPNGMAEFEELVAERERELQLIAKIVSTLVQDQTAYGSLSARDLSLLLRSDALSPAIEEIIPVLERLTSSEIGVLTVVERNASPEHTTYALARESSAPRRLRALAAAIERGTTGRV